MHLCGSQYIFIGQNSLLFSSLGDPQSIPSFPAEVLAAHVPAEPQSHQGLRPLLKDLLEDHLSRTP